jgi:methionyl-tRNA formyltransferase
MRLAFLGNDPWSVPPLEALASSEHDVAVVITNPPRPAGRGSRLTPTAVDEAARRLELPVRQVQAINAGQGLTALQDAAPDVLVVVAYGELLGPGVIAHTPHGAVNLHLSLLPRWRGASPVQHVLLAGDTTTGVTVMQMDAGLDTGPILAQQDEPVREEDDAGSLGVRLAELGGSLLTRVLGDIEAGRAEARAQDQAGATLAPKLTADDRRIDWSADAWAVVQRVRAFAPAPGATTTFRGEPLKILAARVRYLDFVPERISPRVGSLVEAPHAQTGPFVPTSEGAVELLEVAPAGRKRMPAADWARGARIKPGERLG